MNEATIWQVIQHHWKLILLLWVASNIVAAMPSPNGGATGHWAYKWLFGILHGSFGMLPRMFAVIAPRFLQVISPTTAKLMGLPPEVSNATLPTGALNEKAT